MPLSAKSAVPLPCVKPVLRPLAWCPNKPGITLWMDADRAPDASALAAAVQEQQRPTIWLRVDEEDRDPATLLLSLIEAARGILSAPGHATIEGLHRRPGWLSGWGESFVALARAFCVALPPDCVVVIEGCQALAVEPETLGFLGAHFLSLLPASFSIVILDGSVFPAGVLPPHTIHYDREYLAPDRQMLIQALASAVPQLTASLVERAVVLARGHEAFLRDLVAISECLDGATLRRVIRRSENAAGLMLALARAWLAEAPAASVQAIALALRIGYLHPELNRATFGHTAISPGPWLQLLEGGWSYLLPRWREPLRAALGRRAALSWEQNNEAARWLCDLGALEHALGLWFGTGDYMGGAAALDRLAVTLLERGQHALLMRRLAELPPAVLRPHPWLLYLRGEREAARHHLEAARQQFASAAEQFREVADVHGACLSALAESATLVRAGSVDQARQYAAEALTLAEHSGLPWQQGWGAWQLGCLAALADQFDEALSCFDRAAAAAQALDDQQLVAAVRRSEALTLSQIDARRQREQYRQAYLAAEQRERAGTEALRGLLTAPLPELETVLGRYGWLETPLMLKLPASPASTDTDQCMPGADAGRWSRLLGLLGLARRLKVPAAEGSALEAPRDDAAEPGLVFALPLSDADEALSAPEPLSRLAGDSPVASVCTRVATATTALLAACPSEGDAPPPPPNVDAPKRLSLHAYLLGQFRVTVGDQPIRQWPSGRGRMVLKYLLLHRDRPVARDILMDTFWPNAEPEAARNSLNVALYGLRRAIRTVTDEPVVIFEDGCYRLSPELTIWVDVEEFERHVEAARDSEAEGRIAEATAEYEVAVGLYQGDFLAGDLYEDWPALMREHLRLTYLDILDRLSRIYFEHDRYAESATLCQLILQHDSCREDAHRRLMRCYSRQGQAPLALRQYQACVEALRGELGVDAAPATSALYTRIQRREYV